MEGKMCNKYIQWSILALVMDASNEAQDKSAQDRAHSSWNTLELRNFTLMNTIKSNLPEKVWSKMSIQQLCRRLNIGYLEVKGLAS